jgi:hypothetical protein
MAVLPIDYPLARKSRFVWSAGECAFGGMPNERTAVDEKEEQFRQALAFLRELKTLLVGAEYWHFICGPAEADQRRLL